MISNHSVNLTELPNKHPSQRILAVDYIVNDLVEFSLRRVLRCRLMPSTRNLPATRIKLQYFKVPLLLLSLPVRFLIPVRDAPSKRPVVC